MNTQNSPEEVFSEPYEIPVLPFRAVVSASMEVASGHNGEKGRLVLHTRNPQTGVSSQVEFPWGPPDLFAAHYLAVVSWASGTLIQDAFPFLSPEDRELLISGIPSQEFDALFPEDEE